MTRRRDNKVGRTVPLPQSELSLQGGYCSGCNSALVPRPDSIVDYSCPECNALYTLDSEGEIVEAESRLFAGPLFSKDPIIVADETTPEGEFEQMILKIEHGELIHPLAIA